MPGYIKVRFSSVALNQPSFPFVSRLPLIVTLTISSSGMLKLAREDMNQKRLLDGML